jgi:hypothetical protein
MSQMADGKKITVLRFNGPRFEDHGLDVDVLPEISAYKRLLQETAKSLWKRKHPTRQRLPKNFDAEISLKFFHIEPGSTGVPLVRGAPTRIAPKLPFEDELDEAALLLEHSIELASSSDAPPKRLPRNVIPLFQEFGRTLRDDEFIVVSAGAARKGAKYDEGVKTRILSWATTAYHDKVDLIGEVRGTDLDGLRFALRLLDGRKIPGRFEAEQETTVLEALGEHRSRRLRVIGLGEHSPEDGSLQQITKIERVEVVEPEPVLTPQIPIWQRLAAFGAALPEDVWADVPTDLATNVDQYLYRNKEDT